jgi:protein O-mannosyl-transferase
LRDLAWREKDWLFAAALVVAVFFAYQPAWHGGLLWDDEDHVTRLELRSSDGLWRIWTEKEATLQYYPLLHSAFWVEYKLWGDSTLGYHLVNLSLHALSALLVVVILRRLAIPGAWLAAAIFALHPVHVESVAWITEQKNTLSGVFYLGTMLAYLRFDETRKPLSYSTALALFLLGLLCKTVIATLPGAMLVIFWWQRGRLSWKKDVLPLLPFFLLGAGGGWITASWELEINKCTGPEFVFTPVERILIAGRAVWFHLWKLVWPENLTFFYPRWQIDARSWLQYLFPLAAVLLLAFFWSIRRWSRAPLAAALYFGGTLFPVLGFFSLYTFRYSLIANHYQYLASLGIIVLFSAAVSTLLGRTCLSTEKDGGGEDSRDESLQYGQRFPGNLLHPPREMDGYLLCLAIVVCLAVLTWRQSRTYANVETLYRTTIEQNPDCWLAYNNLGLVLAEKGKFKEAIQLYERSLALKPDYDLACNNLGIALIACGQPEKGIEQFKRALEINPNDVRAHVNLGMALYHQGQIGKAVDHYQRAIELNPNSAEAHEYLGVALAGQGNLDEAIVHFQKAVSVKPDWEDARRDLNTALFQRNSRMFNSPRP